MAAIAVAAYLLYWIRIEVVQQLTCRLLNTPLVLIAVRYIIQINHYD